MGNGLSKAFTSAGEIQIVANEISRAMCALMAHHAVNGPHLDGLRRRIENELLPEVLRLHKEVCDALFQDISDKDRVERSTTG